VESSQYPLREGFAEEDGAQQVDVRRAQRAEDEVGSTEVADMRAHRLKHRVIEQPLAHAPPPS
jgi:hypothetical protein